MTELRNFLAISKFAYNNVKGQKSFPTMKQPLSVGAPVPSKKNNLVKIPMRSPHLPSSVRHGMTPWLGILTRFGFKATPERTQCNNVCNCCVWQRVRNANGRFPLLPGVLSREYWWVPTHRVGVTVGSHGSLGSEPRHKSRQCQPTYLKEPTYLTKIK